MQFASFNAVCDVEIGDRVRFDSEIITSITNIRAIYYLKSGKVEFEFETEVAPGIWLKRKSFVYPAPPPMLVTPPPGWVLPKTTPEMCSNCMHEVEIPADQPSMCPVCGEEILPCSTCYGEIDGLKACDWGNDSRCWRFPKSDGVIEIHPDGSRCSDEIVEMHQDGTLCEQCGEYIGEAVGYPRYCAGCED